MCQAAFLAYTLLSQKRKGVNWSRGSAKYLVLFDKLFIQCGNQYDIPLSLLAAWLSKLCVTGASVVFLRSALTVGLLCLIF